MKQYISLILITLSPICYAQAPVSDCGRAIIIHDAIQMDRGQVKPHQVVTIGDGKIQEISNINSAHYSKDALVIGTITEGSASNLLLNGNPLLNIAQSKNISGLMLGNKWLSRDIWNLN